jgi:hypothetical protein
LLGAVLLSLGAAGLAAALVFASPFVFIGGSIVSGLGVGLTFTGALRGISGATTAKSRSEIFSAAFVVSYAALGLPSLAAGLAAPSWGLETTSYLYIAFIGALSLSATLHAGRHLASRPDQSRESRLQSPGEAADRRDDRTRPQVREDTTDRSRSRIEKETTCKPSPHETVTPVSVGSP